MGADQHTLSKRTGDTQVSSYKDHIFRFGIREFGWGAIANAAGRTLRGPRGATPGE